MNHSKKDTSTLPVAFFDQHPSVDLENIAALADFYFESFIFNSLYNAAFNGALDQYKEIHGI